MKNKVQTSLQQNPLLNATDLYEDDDIVTRRMPQQNSSSPQPPHALNTLPLKSNTNILLTISFLKISTKMTNSLTPNCDVSAHTNAKIQTPIKSTSTQSLPFFDPPFFANCNAFENFFLPINTFLTIPILLQAQKSDPVFSTHCLYMVKTKTKTLDFDSD